MIKRISKIIVVLFLLLLVPTLVFADNVLKVKACKQKYDQWCWAGCSYTILTYYGKNVTQCKIANYTRKNATFHDFGNVDCCKSSSTLGWKCNYWNYGYDSKGSIQEILKNWKVDNYGIASLLSKNKVRKEVDAGRPFVIRWGWKSSGGHFVVGHGLNGNNLYYMDPWYGQKKIETYNWVASNNKSDWTHTNVVTTNPGPNPNPDPPNPDPDPPTPSDSCKGHCGGQAPGGCYCDSYCAQYGDCCADKQSVCGY